MRPLPAVAAMTLTLLASACGSGGPSAQAAPSAAADASAGSGDAARRGAFQVSGTVARVSGTCPTLRFLVGGVTVDTDRATVFSPGSCNNVVNGVGVSVTGSRSAAGTMAAASAAVRGTTAAR